MPTWKNYKARRNWETKPSNMARHRARNRARYKAMKEGKVRKGDNKEIDHVGFHPYGNLDDVPTRVVSRSVNRRRQPPGRIKRNYGPRKKKQ